jgi:hypothetical protein
MLSPHSTAARERPGGPVISDEVTVGARSIVFAGADLLER